MPQPQSPTPAQLTVKPPLAFRMMYPYMMGQGFQGHQGYPGLPMSFNPMAMGTPSPAQFHPSQEGELKAFDSSQMKRGRNGHYGYLEGRGV